MRREIARAFSTTRNRSLPVVVKKDGSVVVVGLGPAGPDWLTPEAHAELAAADDLVGYETYLARVPERRGQRRHGSDNRVESERARHALELAAGGSRVAVVSSGDPGMYPTSIITDGMPWRTKLY